MTLIAVADKLDQAAQKEGWLAPPKIEPDRLSAPDPTEHDHMMWAVGQYDLWAMDGGFTSAPKPNEPNPRPVETEPAETRSGPNDKKSASGSNSTTFSLDPLALAWILLAVSSCV